MTDEQRRDEHMDRRRVIVAIAREAHQDARLTWEMTSADLNRIIAGAVFKALFAFSCLVGMLWLFGALLLGCGSSTSGPTGEWGSDAGVSSTATGGSSSSGGSAGSAGRTGNGGSASGASGGLAEGPGGSDPGVPGSCSPGRSEACTGPAGCSGGQTCKPDGTGWGPCECAQSGEDIAAILATCPEDKLSGVCDGQCTGECDGRCFGGCEDCRDIAHDPRFPLGMICDGECIGRCSGACYGTCNGNCAKTTSPACTDTCTGLWESVACVD